FPGPSRGRRVVAAGRTDRHRWTDRARPGRAAGLARPRAGPDAVRGMVPPGRALGATCTDPVRRRDHDARDRSRRPGGRAALPPRRRGPPSRAVAQRDRRRPGRVRATPERSVTRDPQDRFASRRSPRAAATLDHGSARTAPAAMYGPPELEQMAEQTAA